MSEKRVYTFGNGQAEGNAQMRERLGGKGANLAEMNLIGIPVPPGFTIATDVCNEYYEVGQEKIVEILQAEVNAAVAHVENLMNSKFGSTENPLLVSVRSGARASMPGMMDTILNLGLNDEVAEGMVRKTGNPHFVYDSYRRFVQMYGDVVLGMKPVNKEDIDPFEAIIDEVNKVTVADIKFNGNKDLIQIIGKEVDKVYLDMVHSISIDPEVIRRQKDLSIVYTPLHGAGRVLIPDSLKEWGFENINCVPEQMVKDGNFPTVVSPNPENAEALSMAIALAKKIDADIVMASDPDADRVGMACKDSNGEWVLVNGNQTCMIFLYYIIKNRIAMGKMKGNEFVVKTIVTTELIKAIADKNNVEMYDCYTGFKWIASVIRENEGKKQYIGGGEESYGFLAEDFVRDKDAVSACSLLAEICAWAKDQGKTLFDVLMDIYVEYGFSLNHTVNVVKPGKTGADEIKQMMVNFRTNPPKELAGSEVVLTKDYQSLKATDNKGNVTDIAQPATSNVLQWYTADGTKVSVRPSGTEPKIKFYIEVTGEMKCPKCYAEAEKKAMQTVEAVKVSLGL